MPMKPSLRANDLYHLAQHCPDLRALDLGNARVSRKAFEDVRFDSLQYFVADYGTIKDFTLSHPIMYKAMPNANRKSGLEKCSSSGSCHGCNDYAAGSCATAKSGVRMKRVRILPTFTWETTF